MAVALKVTSELSPTMKMQRDIDREIVRGIFTFHEVPGGQMSFSYKYYKGDEVQTYTMVDGETYSIPRGVAKHLNKNCWYPLHHFAVDKDGKPIARIGQKVRRCSFNSLEFMDNDDLGHSTKSVVTVEHPGH